MVFNIQQNWIINKTLYLSLPKYVGNQIMNIWFWYDSEEIPRRLRQLQRTVRGKPLCSQHNFRIVPKTSCGRQNGEEGHDGFYLCADSLDGIYSKRDRDTEGGKSKRYRANFTQNQLVALENQFKTNMFPSRDEQHGLALQLSLSEIQMKRWFQNRRKKIKETKFRIGRQLPAEHFHRTVNQLSAFTFLWPAVDPE